MGKISRLGEFGAIELIKNAAGVPEGAAGLLAGIGDDAAVMRPSAGRDLLATADTLVEGVHFDRGLLGGQYRKTFWRDFGYKSLAVSLSDIAAMGGRPRFYLVSVALTGNEGADDLAELYRGMAEAGAPHKVVLAGGDTVKSPGPVMISVTLLGDVPRGKAVLRSGARPGDDIWVSGTLGDSAAGFELLKAGVRDKGLGVREGQKAESIDRLIYRHLRPDARVKAGMMLGKSGLVSAMIDVSDGLSSDLGHVLRQSGAGGVISEKELPVSAELGEYAGERALKLALDGGEDYELLFTAGRGARERVAALGKKAGARFTRVGEVTGEAGLSLAGARGSVALRPGGYEHFK